MGRRTIDVGYLARVEGEGALHVEIEGNRVKDARLEIFEPPRFFESFLRGRRYDEAPDITSRICGICPIAYQMSAAHAMEDAFGVTVDGQLRALRRLVYCGEWIESHVLHVYLLHAPDFLGYQDAIEISREHPELVQRGLRMKKIGNQLIKIIAGRSIHPINAKVGGFHRTPRKEELEGIIDNLNWGLEASRETVEWVAGLPFPDFERDYEFVALRHPEEYPFNEGRLVSNKGLDIAVKDYEKYFSEEQVEHSTALHSTIKERGNYFVGPLARFNLNFDRLSTEVKGVAKSAGLKPECRNPFMSIIARSIEVMHSFEEALRIIDYYQMPDEPAVKYEPKAANGFGCTEAPRGILYHRYAIDDDGIIKKAKIVPPTSQNQKTIEEDLMRFVTDNLNLTDEELGWRCEQAIRNYDPCISCSTHFLKIDIRRKLY